MTMEDPLSQKCLDIAKGIGEARYKIWQKEEEIRKSTKEQNDLTLQIILNNHIFENTEWLTTSNTIEAADDHCLRLMCLNNTISAKIINSCFPRNDDIKLNDIIWISTKGSNVEMTVHLYSPDEVQAALFWLKEAFKIKIDDKSSLSTEYIQDEINTLLAIQKLYTELKQDE